MNYLLLLMATFGLSAQDVLRKQLDRRHGTPPSGVTMALNFAISAAVLLFFMIAAGFRLSPHIGTLPYALGFAVAYALTMGSSMLAVTAGPLSMASLVMACSMLIPAVHGSLFLQEPFGLANLVGLALLLCALCLVCLDRKEHVEKRWYGYAAVMFFANGMCTTIQKLHQLEFAGAYKSEFMIFASAAVAVVCLLWLFGREGRGARRALAYVWRGGFGIGAANGVVNLLVMYLSVRLPAAAMYPAMSGGSLLISCLAARWLFHEKLSLQRKIGIVCGIAAVVVMNL